MSGSRNGGADNTPLRSSLTRTSLRLFPELSLSPILPPPQDLLNSSSDDSSLSTSSSLSRLSLSSITSDCFPPEFLNTSSDSTNDSSLNSSSSNLPSLDISIALLEKLEELPLNTSIEDLSKRQSRLQHSNLIKIIMALGYKISPAGICLGKVVVARHDILIGQHKVFAERNNFINSITPSNIINALREIKLKLTGLIAAKDSNYNMPGPERLTDNDIKYLNLIAYFEAIVMAQCTEKVSHLLEINMDTQQGSEPICQLIQSIELEKRGGEVRFLDSPAILNQEELSFFLHSYANQCDKLRLKDPVTLDIIGLRHVTNITYLPSDKIWLFTDASLLLAPDDCVNEKNQKKHNHNMQTRSERKLSTDKVAEQIFNAYDPELQKNTKSLDYIAFNFRLHTTKNNTSDDGTNKFGEIKEAFNEEILYGKYQRNRQDITRVDRRKYTFLHAAARSRNYRITSSKDEIKAVVDFKNDVNSSPLFIACFSQNAHAVKAFVDAGANVDDFYITSVLMNPGENSLEIVKILRATGKANFNNQSKQCLIRYACAFPGALDYACEAIPSDILKIEVDWQHVMEPGFKRPANVDKYKMTVLRYLVSTSKTETAQILIDKNLPNIQSVLKIELWWAIDNNNIAVIDFIWKQKMLEDILLTAVKNGNDSMAKQLFTFGFTFKTALKKPALHYAVINKNLRMVEVLLAHDESSKIPENIQSAYDLAKENNFKKITTLLREKLPSSNSPMSFNHLIGNSNITQRKGNETGDPKHSNFTKPQI